MNILYADFSLPNRIEPVFLITCDSSITFIGFDTLMEIYKIARTQIAQIQQLVGENIIQIQFVNGGHI